MKTEKAIETLATVFEYTHIDTDYGYDDADGSVKLVPGKDIADALTMAISSLRTQQEAENPKPLTLDELREFDGDKIYVHYIGSCEGFYDDEVVPYYGKIEQYTQMYEGKLRAVALPLKYYGTQWLAYRHKPKEEVI